MIKREFDSDFSYLINNFSFFSPQEVELTEDFKDLLGGTKGIKHHQTIGGLDAVYFPHGQVKNDEGFLSATEEYYHLNQQRTYSAGWQMEKLLVRFNHRVKSFLEGDLPFGEKLSLQDLAGALAKYKAYLESVRIPLEYQARIRFIYFLILAKNRSLGDSGIAQPPDNLDVSEIPKIQKPQSKMSSLYDNLRLMLGKYVYDFDSSTPPHVSSKRASYKAPRRWLNRISEIVEDLSKNENSEEKKLGFWIIRFLLKQPAMWALNPLVGLESRYLKESEKLDSFPDQRFFNLFQNVLLEIPKSELVDTISNALDSEDLGEAIDTLSAFIKHKIKESIELDFVNSYHLAKILRSSAATLLERSSPDLPSPLKVSPLLPLRPISSLPKPSETCGVVNDNSGPSIKIDKQTTGASTKFLVSMSSEDIISRYFYNQLKLLYEGIKILEQELGLSGLEMKVRGYKLNVQQKAVITLKLLPEQILTPQQEKDLAISLGLPDWPLDNHRISKYLNLPQTEIQDPFGFRRVREKVNKSLDNNNDGLSQKISKLLPFDTKYLKKLDSDNKFYSLILFLRLAYLIQTLVRQQSTDVSDRSIFVKSHKKVLSALINAKIISRDTASTYSQIIGSEFDKVTTKELRDTAYDKNAWRNLLDEIEELIGQSNLGQ